MSPISSRKRGAGIRELEHAALAVYRSGEGPLVEAEELAFEQEVGRASRLY